MHNNEEMIYFFKRIFKYFMFGLIVGIACKYIPCALPSINSVGQDTHGIQIKKPCQKLNGREIIMISIVASVTFAILDIYTPSISY